MPNRHSFGSVSLVTQGSHKFYSLTLPSDILAESCYVLNREEDPKQGFQRLLDVKRAREIANYIDEGVCTIPSSIILSAQEDANLKYDSKKKSLSFDGIENAFLIIDGQHRVYGFHLANSSVRVPVVIYNGLSRRDETRLFIDINTKQRGVPPELLLDIKKMADYETELEELLRDIFDLFYEDSKSFLYGKLSPAIKAKDKISRSTFNTALKKVTKYFGNRSADEVYFIFNNYIEAFDGAVLRKISMSEKIVNPTIFKAIANFFPLAASKCKDTHGAIYNVDDFYNILGPVGENVSRARLANHSNAYMPIVKHLESCLKSDFTL